jgi:chromosome segregation ATPase
MSRSNSEALRRRWEDPAYRERQTAANRRASEMAKQARQEQGRMTKHITVSRGPLGGSEEISQAFVERAAFDAAYTELERWKEAYELLLGAFELRLAINECLGVMAAYGGIVYDVAIGALADQASEARAELKSRTQEYIRLIEEAQALMRPQAEWEQEIERLDVELSAAQSRSASLAKERHDLANEVMQERGKLLAVEAELEAARVLLSLILDSKQVDLKMPEQTAWEYERLIHAYDAAMKAGK